MSLTYAIVFVTAFAACFTLLLMEDRVRSKTALRNAWISLGLSLIVSAIGWAMAGSIGVIGAGIAATALAYLFLGACFICIPFAVYPSPVPEGFATWLAWFKRHPRPSGFQAQARSADAEAFVEWAEQQDQAKPRD